MEHFCFKCNRDRVCLKTGFRAHFDYDTEGLSHETDLFMCPNCGSLSHNTIMSAYPWPPDSVHFSHGRFTPIFVDFVRGYYPVEHKKFFMNGGLYEDILP